MKSDPLALRWSIQSGVSDGCLELFSKAYAPVDHIEVAMVLLRIRADHMYGFIQRGMMAFKNGKLKVFPQLVRGADLYSFIVSHHGSVPTYISHPPPTVVSRAGDWRLYGGFLKACVDCVNWSMNGNMYVNMYDAVYFDPQHEELAYTATVYTV